MGIKEDDKLLTHFILGDLPEEERSRIEEAFFRDDEVYMKLRAIEEDVIDEYARDELETKRGRVLHRRLMSSTRGRKQLEFAAALSSALPSTLEQAGRRPLLLEGWRSRLAQVMGIRIYAYGGALALLLLGVALSWLAVENRRLLAEALQERNEAASLRLETRREKDELGNQLADLESRNKALEDERRKLEKRIEKRASSAERNLTSSVASFVLVPGLLRNVDEPVRVNIPRSVKLVRLQLDLESVEDFASYRTEIRTARGTMVWSKDMSAYRQTAYGQAVTVTVPAGLFEIGDYEVALRGVPRKGELEDIAYYYLTVARN